MKVNDILSDAPICAMLEKYASSSKLRLHMPGHGGKTLENFCDTPEGFLSALFRILPYDVTEIDATDDLLSPKYSILESEGKCAAMYGSEWSFFSCQGATLCLQTAVCASYRLKKQMGVPSPTFLCDRMCHKSIVNAMAVLGIEPMWFDPRDSSTYRKSDVVIVTTVSYYGEVFSDTDSLRSFFGDDTVFIADNSHGSHLMFTDRRDLHPLNKGFDLIIDSIHKTLPSFTGGAVLHCAESFMRLSGVKNEGELREMILSSMRLFSSTSPNFLILASIDLALAEVRSGISAGMSIPLNLASDMIRFIGDRLKDKFGFFTDDPMRAVLRGDHDMAALVRHLEQRSIYTEFYTDTEVILLFPYNMTRADAELLLEALESFETSGVYTPSDDRSPLSLPEKRLTLSEALEGTWEPASIFEALGRISADVYAPYPPGIPVMMPGEVFGEEECNKLSKQFPIVRVLKK